MYAGTGTINTSDEREKQDINPISDDVLDAWSDVQFVQYRWRDAVESKGDAARKHIGVIAQRVHEAFAARGLDAFSYGLLCFDEWHDAFEDIPATYDDTGAVDENGAPVLSLAEPAKRVQTVVAGNRWGIRADECLFLEAALMRRELNRLRSA
ncbi:tail fiber domain-containing protein [Cupriavidus basilensis]|uniref:tail fiber domain-containing protein n=1 Tax=Cupriavidus basilensis TaxID=68895 RepID=UPI0020A697D4|nr:tail fiber domain-containing protein [Cupriavidus basilensis]